MARLVAAFGSSHSIMLVSQREDWQHNFKLIDPRNAHYYDKQGNKTDYDALLAAAPAGCEAMVTPEKMSERYDAAEAAMDELHERIKAACLDLLLIVGDDQTELFRTSNNPAIAIYYGPTIRNTAREPASPGDSWVKSARMWRHEPEVDREYPRRWIGKVTVRTTDGRELHARVDEPKGDPGNTLSRAEVEDKAVRLAQFSGAATAAEVHALARTVLALPSLDRVGTLLPAAPQPTAGAHLPIEV